MCEIKKTFSIHTDYCTDNCTNRFTIEDIVNTFGIDVEKWNINFDLTIE